MPGFDPVFGFSSLDGTNGIQISGESAYDQSGFSVASAGDVNGDGFDDLIIGAIGADPNGSYSGASYVVFGQAGGFAASVALSDLDGTNGFQISGEAERDHSGWSVASAGDVNGDGFDDLIIGAFTAVPNGSYSGASYVVFGQAGGSAAEIELSDLDGTNGFQISGEAAFDRSGFSVASAGDVNGDGFDDLIIGAYGAHPHGPPYGASYVVFGQAGGFAAEIELSDLDGTDGFQISGEGPNFTGRSVASAGDVNGDGFDDLIVGAPEAGNGSGASYVVFGHAGGFAAEINLSALDGTNGFQISGEAAYDGSGRSVASAGDVNGDGFDDLIVGANGADPNGNVSGASYVVFGQAGGFAAEIELSDLDGTNGFQISGESGYDFSGRSVASAGDVNGDGFDDLIIGAHGADPNGNVSGASYVVFGQAGGFAAEIDVSNLDGTNGFKISGESAYDRSGYSVASAGDVNGDGFDDLIVGADSADPNGKSASGASYVVFGQATTPLMRVGTDFADHLIGGDFADTLEGRGGNDTLDGRGDADTMLGGAGDDTYVVDNAGDTTTEAAGGGTDLVQSSVSVALAAELENLTLTGSATINGTGNDVANALTGNAAANTLKGLGGNDHLDGGGGADSMAGGAGNDTYVADNAGDTTVEVAGGGTDTVQSSVTYTLAAQVEKLTLTGSSNINGIGNALNNTIVGNSGNNTLNGQAGVDAMTGGSGNDTYIVDNAGDTASEASGSGVDRVQSTVTFTLATGVENLILAGTAAVNGTGNASVNAISGNSGANTLSGLAGNDTLTGLGGNDRLDGGSNADAMSGGNGNDTYIVDNAGDTVSEASGSGVDVVQSTVTFTLGTDVENLILTGTAAINGTGNTLANALTGNTGNNTLNGGSAADTLTGLAGNDKYMVDNVGDVVVEASSAGTDLVQSSVSLTLAANVEDLTLTGSANLNGTGNTLANVLTGNTGNNTLAGAGGADTFFFNATLNAATNVDHMTDFATEDTINLENAVFTTLTTTGTLAASGFFSAAGATSAHDADDRIVYNTTTGALFYDADGIGGSASVQFAVVDNHAALTNADFLVV